MRFVQSQSKDMEIMGTALLQFLANVNVHVRYMLSPVRLSSVCLSFVVYRLSVGNAGAPYSGGCNFRQFFYGI